MAGLKRQSGKRMRANKTWRVIYYHQGEVYEIFAKSVGQGTLYGFVEVEELLFGERSQVVVDPAEDRLKSEFSGVKRTYIPLHSVIRIDEVEKEGKVRIHDLKGEKVMPFPMGPYTGNPTK
jgi:hypothetical protein